MDEMMNSVSVQIQRAINDAISNQVLPQIQNAIVAGSGHLTRERWNVPAERPEGYSEVLRNSDSRDNSRSKPFMDCQKDGPTTSTNARAYDNSLSISRSNDIDKAQYGSMVFINERHHLKLNCWTLAMSP